MGRKEKTVMLNVLGELFPGVLQFRVGIQHLMHLLCGLGCKELWGHTAE